MPTSVDGVLSVKLSHDGETWSDKMWVALEIKTLSSKVKESAFQEALCEKMEDDVVVFDTSNIDKENVVSCCIGDEFFMKIVPTVGYRLQVLHHATIPDSSRKQLQHQVDQAADTPLAVGGDSEQEGSKQRPSGRAKRARPSSA